MIDPLSAPLSANQYSPRGGRLAKGDAPGICGASDGAVVTKLSSADYSNGSETTVVYCHTQRDSRARAQPTAPQAQRHATSQFSVWPPHSSVSGGAVGGARCGSIRGDATKDPADLPCHVSAFRRLPALPLPALPLPAPLLSGFDTVSLPSESSSMTPADDGLLERLPDPRIEPRIEPRMEARAGPSSLTVRGSGVCTRNSPGERGEPPL